MRHHAETVLSVPDELAFREYLHKSLLEYECWILLELNPRLPLLLRALRGSCAISDGRLGYTATAVACVRRKFKTFSMAHARM